MKKLTIRDYQDSDATYLRAVFYSAVHESTGTFYNPQQRDAWAPIIYDIEQWTLRLHQIQPFVALLDDKLVGYADLQADGYIDHFFVHARFQNQGIGNALWHKILSCAKTKKIDSLCSEVSLAAEHFFLSKGFIVEARQHVFLRGCYLSNAKMIIKL